MVHDSGTRPKTRRGRVLVVDDDPMVAQALALCLRDENDVSVAIDGVEALGRLTASETFDVVLCDLMMPRMSGPELFEAVSAAKPALARTFVFVTGGAVTASARAFLASVSNVMIEKPPDPLELRALVRHRVAEAQRAERDRDTGAA